MNRRSKSHRLLDDDWLYMSAVCYLYGVYIHKHTAKPVGLINTNWGGTPIEFWSSPDALQRCQSPGADAVHEQALRPSGGYNGMIKPFFNMTIFGVIWYQGESNSEDPVVFQDPQGLPMARYGCRFPEMIADWRLKWHDGTHGETAPTFSFGYVHSHHGMLKVKGQARYAGRSQLVMAGYQTRECPTYSRLLPLT